MPVLNIGVPPIGGWANMGVVYVLTPSATATLPPTLLSAHGSVTEVYEGEIVFLQGGNVNYGTRNKVHILILNANSMVVARDVGVGFQIATLNNTGVQSFGGTSYHMFKGQLSGPGTNGEEANILFQ